MFIDDKPVYSGHRECGSISSVFYNIEEWVMPMTARLGRVWMKQATPDCH